MPLGPDIVERLNRARADLRMGVPVALVAGGRGALALAAEALDPARFAALAAMGPMTLAITDKRAATLKARIARPAAAIPPLNFAKPAPRPGRREASTLIGVASALIATVPAMMAPPRAATVKVVCCVLF